MTCSQDRFLSGIPRRHISKGFPLVVSLAKPPSTSQQSIRLSSHCSPSAARAVGGGVPDSSCSPTAVDGTWWVPAVSDTCKELLLHLQQELGSCMAEPWCQVQQSTAQILEIQLGPKLSAAVGFGRRCWGGTSPKLPVVHQTGWLLPQCWLLQL